MKSKKITMSYVLKRTRKFGLPLMTVVLRLFVGMSAANAQIKVVSNGNVGVGEPSPSYKLSVAGVASFAPGWVKVQVDWSTNNYCPAIHATENNALWLGRDDKWANHMWCYTIDYQNMAKVSDSRLKENIAKCPSMLSQIKKIKTYTYNYTDEYFKDFTSKEKAKLQRKEFGFIAQELAEVFPELVFTSDSGRMSVDYVSMVPILTAAINELQQQVETMQTIVSSQEQEIVALKNKIVDCCTNNNFKQKSKQYQGEELNMEGSDQEGKLYDNIPNPFTSNTEIQFEIPENATSAYLLIYTLQGAELKSYTLTQKGLGSITISGSELAAGMYLYTLLIDNKIIDTKRMILTK
jgi:hypothetical protein